MVDETFWVSVLPSDALADGEMTAIQHGDRRIAIYRLDGTHYATDDLCTQPLTYLTDGCIEDGDVVCPRQDGRFDIRTGRGFGAPRACDLRTYPVRTARGNLEVLLEKA